MNHNSRAMCLAVKLIKMKRIIWFLLLLIPFVVMSQTVGQFRYDTTKFLKSGGQTVVKVEGALQASVDGAVKTSTFTANSIGRSFILGDISIDETVTFPTLESGRVGTFIFVENRNTTVNAWNVSGPVKMGADYDDVLTVPKGPNLFWWGGTNWLMFTGSGGSGGNVSDTIIFVNGPYVEPGQDTLLVRYDDSTILAKSIGTDLPGSYKTVTATNIKWNIGQYVSDSATHVPDTAADGISVANGIVKLGTTYAGNGAPFTDDRFISQNNKDLAIYGGTWGWWDLYRNYTTLAQFEAQNGTISVFKDVHQTKQLISPDNAFGFPALGSSVTVYASDTVNISNTGYSGGSGATIAAHKFSLAVRKEDGLNRSTIFYGGETAKRAPSGLSAYIDASGTGYTATNFLKLTGYSAAINAVIHTSARDTVDNYIGYNYGQNQNDGYVRQSYGAYYTDMPSSVPKQWGVFQKGTLARNFMQSGVMVGDSIDRAAALQVNGDIWINKDSVAIASGGANYVLQLDTATGKVTRSLSGGGGGGSAPAGNFGNIQINRNGVLTTPASDSLSFDATTLNVKGEGNFTGQVFGGNMRVKPSYTTGSVADLTYLGNGIDAQGSLVLYDFGQGQGSAYSNSLITLPLTNHRSLFLPNEDDTLATRGFVRGLAGGSGTTSGPFASRPASPSVGQFYYQTDLLEGLYMYDGNSWGYQPDDNTDVWEKFMGNNTGFKLGGNSSGTGAAHYQSGDYFSRWRMETGSTAAGIAQMRLANNYFSTMPTAGKLIWYYKGVRLGALSDGTDDFTIRVGHSAIADNIGFFFKYNDGSSSGQWECVVHDGSTATTVASGVTVAANTDYEMLIVMDYAGTDNCKFYINNTLVATITTTLPANLTGSYQGSISIMKNLGTTNRNMLIDDIIIKYIE